MPNGCTICGHSMRGLSRNFVKKYPFSGLKFIMRFLTSNHFKIKVPTVGRWDSPSSSSPERNKTLSFVDFDVAVVIVVVVGVAQVERIRACDVKSCHRFVKRHLAQETFFFEKKKFDLIFKLFYDFFEVFFSHIS